MASYALLHTKRSRQLLSSKILVQENLFLHIQLNIQYDLPMMHALILILLLSYTVHSNNTDLVSLRHGRAFIASQDSLYLSVVHAIASIMYGYMYQMGDI